MVVLAGGMKWGRLFSEFDLSVRNTMTTATATGSRKIQHHDAHHRRPILTIPSDTIAGITCKRIRIHLPYIQFLLYLAAYTNHILCIDPPNISSWGCTSAAGTRSFSCRYPSQPSPFLFFRCGQSQSQLLEESAVRSCGDRGVRYQSVGEPLALRCQQRS